LPGAFPGIGYNHLSPSLQNLLSEIKPSDRRLLGRNAEVKGNKSDKVSILPGKALLYMQEWDREEEGHSGHLHSEQVHSMPTIQDDLGVPATPRSVESSPKVLGWP